MPKKSFIIGMYHKSQTADFNLKRLSMRNNFSMEIELYTNRTQLVA